MSLAPLAASCAASDLGCQSSRRPGDEHANPNPNLTLTLTPNPNPQSSRRPGDEHAERLLLFERRRGGVGLAAQLLGA